LTRLFIHATNVHQGGGKTLILSLLQAAKGNPSIVFCLDSRLQIPHCFDIHSLILRRVSPSIAHRFFAEYWLRNNVSPSDIVLCFGNLPPLFRLPCHVSVFVQNRYLVENASLHAFPIKIRLRLIIERFWLRWKLSNVNEFIVQTPSMKRSLEALSLNDVNLLPFIADQFLINGQQPILKMKTHQSPIFVYVASGEPHKNHQTLFEAWYLLAKEGIFPALKLTLDHHIFNDLCSRLHQKIDWRYLNIVNLGKLSQVEIIDLYKTVNALIYPSLFESFGLPLIEAHQAGLSILASELDFVRDVAEPDQTFNPHSAISIARAVKRYLGIEENHLDIKSASAFLQHIITRSNHSADFNS